MLIDIRISEHLENASGIFSVSKAHECSIFSVL